jgi:organic hydroperoxide reductase OsmC/OhrA
MAAHTATIAWERGDQPFLDGKYSRRHRISFDGGVGLDGSAAPGVVRPPMSAEDAADPEEMLVASLSMCHMLFFLDFARRGGFVPDSYVDSAEGILAKDERGRIAVTKVTLKPAVVWSGERLPTAAEIEDLHHKSHEACFIANSFRGTIAIEGH